MSNRNKTLFANEINNLQNYNKILYKNVTQLRLLQKVWSFINERNNK